MIRNTLTAIAITLTLTACSDSHDITTTDINVNTTDATSRASTTYHGNMLWIDCDGYVTNMLTVHGSPSYTKTLTEERENFDLLTETSYYYADADLRFVVAEYRDGSCATFTSSFHA